MIRDASAWTHVLAVTRPALALAPRTFLADIVDQLREAGVSQAVQSGDCRPVIDWMLQALSLQGISDAAAYAFDARHGGIRSDEIARGLRYPPACRRLATYGSFAGCGYRKADRTCAAPDILPNCPLPRHTLRKGGLNVASYGLWLFVRDECGGDLIGWIDAWLAAADPGSHAPQRAAVMRDALIEPLTKIPNTGRKLWSMILADFLLAADPARERWVTAGASFVAVDTLVHAFLHRTGILSRLAAEHSYGPACYGPNGCAEIIAALAQRIDARVFDPAFPACFPRFVQFALWQFCAADHRDICNGVQIDDRERCAQVTCPTYSFCDRISLSETARLRVVGSRFRHSVQTAG